MYLRKNVTKEQLKELGFRNNMLCTYTGELIIKQDKEIYGEKRMPNELSKAPSSKEDIIIDMYNKGYLEINKTIINKRNIIDIMKKTREGVKLKGINNETGEIIECEIRCIDDKKKIYSKDNKCLDLYDIIDFEFYVCQKEITFMEALNSDGKVKVVLENKEIDTEWLTIDELIKYFSKYKNGELLLDLMKNGKWYEEL